MMTSLSLQKRLQITFDRSRRISGASGSDSEIVGFIVFVGLRPMEHGNMNIN